jgi:predicted ATPase
MGDAVNLAARMEQTAEPGAVQVSDDTHRLIAPLFDFEPLGPIEVKGKSEPVPAYRVLGPKAQPGRLRGLAGLHAPLIGRAREYEQLRRPLNDVRQGQGQIVCLSGEAGLGKSRLIHELSHEWQATGGRPGAWIESSGLSYDTTRPYGLFRRYLSLLYGVQEGDSPEVVRQKALKSMQALSPEQRRLRLRAVELLLAARAESANSLLQGEAFKRELFQTGLDLWREIATTTPIVLVFDDLHWADPASVELLLHLFQLVEELPILFLCAFRPEEQSPAWQIQPTAATKYTPYYTEISLKPLSSEDSNTLVDSLLTIADLPQPLRRLILQKTEGNPFFVEEVVRTLIDNGTVVRDEVGAHWYAVAEVETIHLPDNIQALLLARIDQLEKETRYTLQLASVIGREFYYRVLNFISDRAVALDKQLEILQQVDLIREAARTPELAYMFRHELTRDAAYNSILHRRRRQFHRYVAEAMEALFAGRLAEEAHRLAYHFQEARDQARALTYYKMAGDTAARLYANTEAIVHYTHALQLARQTSAANEQLIYLYINRGRVLEVSGAYDEALANYQELEHIGHERGDHALVLAALLPQATIYATYTDNFDPAQAKTLSEQALALAQALNDPRAEAKALWNRMLLEMFTQADLQPAVTFGERSLAIARAHNLREELAYTLHDISRAYLTVGRLKEAWAAQREAQDLWRAMENLPMLADSLASAAAAYYMGGLFDKALSLAQEALQINQAIGSLWGQAYSLMTLGPIYLERGELGVGIKALQTAISLAERANFSYPQIIIPTVLAWIYGGLGLIEQGFALAHQGLAKAENLAQSRPQALAAFVLLHLNNGDLDQANTLLQEMLSGYDASNNDRYIGHFFVYVQGQVALANQAYDHLLDLSDKLIDSMKAVGVRLFLCDILHFKAQALLGLGRTDEAIQVLQAARAEAESLNSRRALWLILTTLTRVEAERGHTAASEELRRQAQAIIAYMADHMETAEFRTAFFNLPDVQAIIEKSNGQATYFDS